MLRRLGVMEAMLGGLLAIVVLAACSDIGVGPWIGYGPLGQARERGLDVEPGSNTESSRVLHNGFLCVAGPTPEKAAYQRNAGLGRFDATSPGRDLTMIELERQANEPPPHLWRQPPCNLDFAMDAGATGGKVRS